MTYSDLNAEFNNILNNPGSLITPITFNLTFTDATYDIGASGATRPRDLFLSRNAVIGGTLGVTGATTLSAALTYGGVALTNAVTGTGKMVLDTSPTLVTPALGTPSALVGTNITGTAASLTAGTASAVAVGGITGLGTGVATALAVNTGSSGAVLLHSGALVGSSLSTGSGAISGGAGSFTTGTFTDNILCAPSGTLQNAAGWDNVIQVQGAQYPAISLRKTNATAQQWDIANNNSALSFYDGTNYAMTLFNAGGLNLGAPTGGDKGLGTINAAGAYYANGDAGVASFGPSAVASITVKNGIITAIS